MRSFFRAVAILIITGVVVPLATAATVLGAFIFLPLPAVLPEAKPGIEAQISRVYDINGNLIGVFRRFEQTKDVKPEDIPQVLKNAVIAAEDRRFYEHGGVDVRGIFRALWADIQNKQVVQGGSTITQQYVKVAYTEGERTVWRKVREAVLASQLDRKLDKEEILFKYLTRAYFGEGAIGIGAAAETYFHKPVNELTLSEAATLAGLLPAPSRYEPRGNVQLAETRRKLVLKSMLREGMITQQEHDQAVPEGLWLLQYAPVPEGFPATVVHPRQSADTAYPYFMDYVRRYMELQYGEDAVYQKGYQIYTTLDPLTQAAAERAVGKTLEGTAPPLEMALVAVEPQRGFVKALVGGRDFRSSNVNLALGRVGRQPGSAFKPFVLATAFEKGVSSNKTYSGKSGICLGGGAKPYCPKNYGGSSYGTLSLRQATAKSVNAVFAQLIRDVGVKDTMDLAKRLGLSTANFDESRHGYSVALGAVEATPIDMASAYGVWAARGLRAEPTPVVRVLTHDGQVLEDNVEPQTTRIVSEVTADNMNDVLEGPLQAGGTAGDNSIDRPAAGKTGTTNDNGDAWFVGYTPTLSTAVWMGYRDSRAPLRNIKGVGSVTGGSHPAATWEAFMREALEDVPATEFEEPAPITPIADDAKKKARAGFDAGRPRYAEETDAGGTYVGEIPPPDPYVSTTTSSTSSTTTTTTTPITPGDDDGVPGQPGRGPPGEP